MRRPRRFNESFGRHGEFIRLYIADFLQPFIHVKRCRSDSEFGIDFFCEHEFEHCADNIRWIGNFRRNDHDVRFDNGTAGFRERSVWAGLQGGLKLAGDTGSSQWSADVRELGDRALLRQPGGYRNG